MNINTTIDKKQQFHIQIMQNKLNKKHVLDNSDNYILNDLNTHNSFIHMLKRI